MLTLFRLRPITTIQPILKWLYAAAIQLKVHELIDWLGDKDFAVLQMTTTNSSTVPQTQICMITDPTYVPGVVQQAYSEYFVIPIDELLRHNGIAQEVLKEIQAYRQRVR